LMVTALKAPTADNGPVVRYKVLARHDFGGEA
jgi:hypothetical protein